MQPIDLHLVSWNRPKMTELVISAIHRNTKPKNFRLSVLDNGSDKETQDMLSLLYDNGKIDELINFKENHGLEEARQFALVHNTDSGYFVCVDNDCLPPPIKDGKDWLERLIDLMEKYEDYAAIAMRTQVMIGTGNIFDGHEHEDIVPFPHPGGSYRIMRTEAVRSVGGWGRGEPGRGAEERYICGKLRDAGYKTAFATNIKCLHLFGTRGENGTDRWGYDPSYNPEQTGHSDIWHPALTNGDDKEEVSLFAGDEYAERYFT